MWIILGDHFWMDSVLSSFCFDSGYIISVSPRGYRDFTNFLREGGPRILCVSLRTGNLELFLRALCSRLLDVSLIFHVKVNPDVEADSVLSPAAGDFRTNFTHFPDEGGLGP